MLIKSLILVGGYSTRMGHPKYSLSMKLTNGRQQSLLSYLIQCHRHFQLDVVGSNIAEVVISVRDEAQQEEIEELLGLPSSCNDLSIKYVLDASSGSGPVTGFLAAYNQDRECSWVVTGCDYPLLEPAALQQLWTAHRAKTPAVTSFVNEDGFSEPLLAIWSPTALSLLKDLESAAQAEGRQIGPNRVIRVLQSNAEMNASPNSSQSSLVMLLSPERPQWLRNVNTPSEWEQVQPLIAPVAAGSIVHA